LDEVLKNVSWFMAFILIYIYIGYPILCFLIARLNGKPVSKDEELEPCVTLIISAYNEEASIAIKIRNSLKLDYPGDKLEIIVVSDGSTDATANIVKSFAYKSVRVLDYKENRGKTAVQNDAAREAWGEILVFSDANSIYEKNAIRKLVRNFKDPKVGCVCGELTYINPNDASSRGEGLYWRYEKFMKKQESLLGNAVGANGSIYAVRKELYIPLKEDIISDFIEPLEIAARGYRVVYEDEALCYEYASPSYSMEFHRKVRIVARSFRGFLSILHMLNPFKFGFISISLISHKLLRWFAGLFLVILFFVNVVLAINLQGIYTVMLYMQILFYLLAVVGLITRSRLKPLFVPAYFCMVNFASLLGILKLLFGEKFISWQPVRK